MKQKCGDTWNCSVEEGGGELKLHTFNLPGVPVLPSEFLLENLGTLQNASERQLQYTATKNLFFNIVHWTIGSQKARPTYVSFITCLITEHLAQKLAESRGAIKVK